MSRFFSTTAIIWRLAKPYFYSEDRRAGRILLAAVIAIELSLTGINVLINQWQARFYNALEVKNWDAFVTEMMTFILLAGTYVVLAGYQLYLQQWLQIRFRNWMTWRYLDQWLIGATHYRMQLSGDSADNPDQRIADDIRLFVERGLSIGLRVFGAGVSFSSFVVILWTLSDNAPFRFFGYELPIPGYLVWGALIYAVFGTALTHLIGRPLIGLNFQQQRFEADFRFDLVRVRENSEQIALMQGEPAEDQRLRGRFGFIVSNWHDIMARTMRITMFTTGFRQCATIIPFILVGPAYFAGRLQFGGLMQAGGAFTRVQEALSIFVDVYREIAEWRAVVDRLDGFDTAIAQARAVAANPEVQIAHRTGSNAVEFDDVLLQLPNGTPLVTASNITVQAGDRVLVSGPSGAGKSTLFRAIAGIWPFGKWTIAVPAVSSTMVLPQRPYFPIATLAAAVTYPAPAGSFSRDQLVVALVAVGLPALAERLDEEAHWNNTLSVGEQQRLSLARAILQKPDYLFLDEATSALDEPAEAKVYGLLLETLTGSTIVSIAHRSTLVAFHSHRLAFVRDGDHHRLVSESLVGVA
ncbi:MAG TPA: ABC transporter ATP-binding protein/permease [Xanthobacteraceae bacterium]|nr:ABC transporter ATP-binding protein/permease [Xanthobacteraceae bacterium]